MLQLQQLDAVLAAFCARGIGSSEARCDGPAFLKGSVTTGLVAAEGPHAFDFESNRPEDPPSLAQARQQGQQSISSWVDQWNAKKTQMPLSTPADLLHFNPALTKGYTTYLNSTTSDGLAVTNLTAITA